jgi:hypothetical protein
VRLKKAVKRWFALSMQRYDSLLLHDFVRLAFMDDYHVVKQGFSVTDYVHVNTRRAWNGDKIEPILAPRN